MSKSKYLLGACALSLICTSGAQAHELSMTIYGNNRALVEDSRIVEFDKGEQVITLTGVSSMIEPNTVSFLAEDITLLEQNFDFDLITPAKLMEKAIGEYVQIVRTHPATGNETRHKAKVLSVNNGVVLEVDGHIEILRDDDIPTRVIFDEIPENLRPNPTLSVSVDSQTRSERPVLFNYLTRGLTWSVDYIANYDEQAETLDLQGWATINNTTKTDFEDADVTVIAGQIQDITNPNGYYRHNNNWQTQLRKYSNMRGQNYNSAYNQLRNSGQIPNNNTGLNIGESLNDFKMFRLPGLLDINSSQKKQINIIDIENIGAEKTYEYSALGFYAPPMPVSADIRLGFANTQANGIGTGLPRGTLRVYVKDSEGRSQFSGEDAIGHTPAGEILSIKTGEAFDVRIMGKAESLSTNRQQPLVASMVYTLTNSKNKAVTVHFRQTVPGGDHTLDSESQKSIREDAFTRLWKVKVPAGGSKKLSFTITQPR